MTDAEIVHPIPVDETAGWLSTLSTTFFGDPYRADFGKSVERRRRRWEPDRRWGARGEGRWVATLATQERWLTVPGPDGTTTDLRADALTGVTVNATHRRRGLLTAMLGSSLDAAKERGDAVSMLIAAEWPIYGRFGYAPATSDANYSYFPRQPAAKITPSGRGGVRQVDPAEAGRLGPQVHRAARSLRAGQVDRPAAWWWTENLNLDEATAAPDGKTPNFVVRENDAGAVDGLVGWRATRDFDLAGNMAVLEVTDLVAASDDGYRDLWAYLSGIDAVGEIVLTDRPVDEPIRWALTDGRALRQTYAGDHLWLRLLDVPAALSARSYAADGRLVLDVVDPGPGYAAGRFALHAEAGAVECVPSTDPPELRVTQRALASIYLGGHSLREIALGGGVEELDSGAVRRADAMFATWPAPWNQTGF